MNAVEVSVEGIDTPEWLERARSFAKDVLDELGKDGWDLSLLLCDDGFIRGLNRQYRDRDEPTDVLSFEQGESYRDPEGGTRYLAGDIVISLDSLGRNADENGVSRENELKRLIVHGVLHLSGMDHEDNDASRPMLVLQEELLRKLAARGGRR
jgi:probable rRNA maturation factor